MTSFDERMRMRSRAEDCQVPKGFDARLAARLRELPAPERRSGGVRPLRVVLLAAALCILCLVTALAVSPALREALDRALGSFAAYSSPVEGVSALDQGIELRVAAVLADDHLGTVLIEMTDLTEDRLDAQTAWGNPTGERVCQAYDGETKTALFCRSVWPEERSEDGEITIRIERIFPGVEVFSKIPIPWERLVDRTLDSFELPAEVDGQLVEHRSVLVPDQTPMDLEGMTLFSVSALGYDKDGSLHLQLKLAEGTAMDGVGIFPETDGVIRCQSNVFLLEDGRYVDWVFRPEAGATLDGNLPETLYGQVYTKPPIRGSWTLTFPLDALPMRSAAAETELGDLRIEEIRLSAMGLQVDAAYLEDLPDPQVLWSLPVALHLEDGSVITGLRCVDWQTIFILDGEKRMGSSGGGARYGNRTTWAYPCPVDPEQVSAVSFGELTVPLE